MTVPYIAIVGLGNMGSAIADGLLAAGHPAGRLCAVVPPGGEAAAKARGLAAYPALDALPADVGVVVLAVKPQDMQAVAQACAPLVVPARLVISIAAGVTTDKLAGWLGADARIVRAMPNTPAAIGQGMTGLFARTDVTAAQKQAAEGVFSAVGSFVWLEDEGQMDALTAVSGSGPAYAFLLMEAMTAAGVAQGLPEETAEKLAVAAVAGAGALAQKNLGHRSAADLRQAVTSPGGTTEAALAVLEHAGLRDMVGDAVAAAATRSKIL